MNNSQQNDQPPSQGNSPQLPVQTLSLRAVLTNGQADVSQALDQAGLFEPVSVPVLLGDQPEDGAILGDGITQNIQVVLEIAADGTARLAGGS